MKSNTTRKTTGFTLLELLTVLAILGILLTLLVSSISNAIQQARKASAGAAVKNIAHATRAYLLDYGKYPAVAAPTGPDDSRIILVGEPESLATTSNADLFNTLRAIAVGKNENHKLNPRRQRYYEDRVAKNMKPPRGGFADGSLFPPELAGCYLDPWGRQYCIATDADGDDTLDLSPIFSDLTGPGNLVRQNPAVFCLGIDGIRGARGYEGLFQKPDGTTPPDDIVSWR
jgi:prepilin-type N-terminal cleavage/methylation domain-containing protein